MERVVEEAFEVRRVVIEDSHDLAGLLVVEEGHVEVLEFSEAVGPDVVHHPVGEVVRRHAVDPGEQGRHEKRPDDQRDRELKLGGVARRDPGGRDEREPVGGPCASLPEDRIERAPNTTGGSKLALRAITFAVMPVTNHFRWRSPYSAKSR